MGNKKRQARRMNCQNATCKRDFEADQVYCSPYCGVRVQIQWIVKLPLRDLRLSVKEADDLSPLTPRNEDKSKKELLEIIRESWNGNSLLQEKIADFQNEAVKIKIAFADREYER